MNVGKFSQSLLDKITTHQAISVTFITAFNPLGKLLSEADNKIRHEYLIKDLNNMKLEWIDGVGQDPDGLWPSEKSLLIFDLDLEAARELGNRHEQNAILWSDRTATMQLILLR